MRASTSPPLRTPPFRSWPTPQPARRCSSRALNRISNISTEQAGVGQEWDYEFNWFGLVVTGHSQCTQYERPALYQFKTLTGSPSTWTYRFEPDGGGTRLTREVDYELPQNQIARFATAGTLEQMNRNRAREIVANLKALLEP